MFTRLDSPLPRLPPLPDGPARRLRYRFGKVVNGQFYGLSYFHVDGPIEEALLGVLPEALRSRFLCSYMVANHHDIPPHIDNGIQLSLNYYVVTAGATTSFYRFRHPHASVERLENNDPGSASGLYQRQDLEVVGSFVAKAHELWALDVSQPHDVVSAAGQGPREAYCLQSRTINLAELLRWASDDPSARPVG